MAARTLLIAAAFATAVLAAPAPLEVEERQACGAVWTQCGGNNWQGATCCASGSYCSVVNEWYHQCLPGAATSSVRTTSSARPTSTSSSSARTSSSSVRSTSSSSVRTSSSSATRTSSASSTRVTSATTSPPPIGSGTATFTGNPYSGVNLWANNYYRSEVLNLAVPSLTGAMATAAARVAEVPSYMWLDTFSKTPLLRETLADIRRANAAGGNYAGQFVVYNLPDRDCAAAASNGEYAIDRNGVANYRNYIDTIREILLEYSDIRTILVIEPDSLANMVTNMNVPKCANAANAYHECTLYAIDRLNLPQVAMYLDAGHAGWLGWPANQPGAARLFGELYVEAGRPRALRGLVTNVSNYNAWLLSSPPSYTTPNPVYDESKYVHALGPLLETYGWPGARFITDQGRSGRQPTGQLQWGHWCNALGTGFGRRPSADTGDALLDAFVWVKPGGEADGTSDTTAVRYDHFCGSDSSMKPAPEAGTWFQAYFVQLLQNANPSFL